MLLYRAFHAQRNILRPDMRALGLGAGQPKLIAYLAANGPCRQRDLADYFEVDPAAISRMVDSLEKGGFITVEADGFSTEEREAFSAYLTRARQNYVDWKEKHPCEI